MYRMWWGFRSGHRTGDCMRIKVCKYKSLESRYSNSGCTYICLIHNNCSSSDYKIKCFCDISFCCHSHCLEFDIDITSKEDLRYIPPLFPWINVFHDFMHIYINNLPLGIRNPVDPHQILSLIELLSPHTIEKSD